MKINETAKEIYETAKAKGWYDKGARPIPELLMLMVSELSEAMEEYRKNMPPLYINLPTPEGVSPVEIDFPCFESFVFVDVDKKTIMKPEGIAVEMADCVIRIMDTFAAMGWDLEKIMKAKMEYNNNRPYRHGGKRC